jgi:hypothetical protein
MTDVTRDVLLPAPQKIEDTGLSADLILQMVTKTLHFAGELKGTELAGRLGVSFSVLESSLELLRRERHCEISNGTMVGASSFVYRLTDAGRVRAAVYLDDNRYVGPLPVPLEQYQAYMRHVREGAAPTRDAMRSAFSHLVLSSRILDQLGPAIAAWHSLFLYGPPGNGKTVVSQAIRNVLQGHLAIPHALSIDGHIVRVFDPVNHEPVEDQGGTGSRLELVNPTDGRWVNCRRPLVTVGGELTLDALDLSYSAVNGFYRAPVQAIANGGVLVIDDFGRQHITPRDLLNRWIVPLESRVDFLTLQTGQKFELPFKVFVVFATNLKPGDLVDEAFLRRLRYKILAESPSVDEFVQIFANYCRDKQVPCPTAVIERLVEDELRRRGVPLRGCYPRDLIEHALALGEYLGRPRELTSDLLSDACALYFVQDRDLTNA